jgi:hypothetical protein
LQPKSFAVGVNDFVNFHLISAWRLVIIHTNYTCLENEIFCCFLRHQKDGFPHDPKTFFI